MALQLGHVDVLFCGAIVVIALGIPVDSLGRAHIVWLLFM